MSEVILDRAQPAVPMHLALVLIVLLLLHRLPVVQGGCVPTNQKRRLNVHWWGSLGGQREHWNGSDVCWTRWWKADCCWGKKAEM